MENTMIEKVLWRAEEIGWTVINTGEYVELLTYSPGGREFSFDVYYKAENKDKEDVNILFENIYNYYEDFDVSYETYIWLDNEGHGTNGAPYDMKDLYEDTQWIENEIYNLHNNLKYEYKLLLEKE